MELLAIYADESCLGNGREGENRGAAGGVVEWKSPKSGAIVRWDYWISEPGTTNNRMALQSVIQAFRGIAAKGKTFRVVFTTDSKYIVEGMTKWVHGWAANGWTRKAGPIENLELWKEALQSLGAQHCQWRWVKGHNGQPQNEYANFLATRAAAEQNSSKGLVSSRFDEWCIEHGGSVLTRQQMLKFPTDAEFDGKQKIWKL
jgi:ribonuclease HI